MSGKIIGNELRKITFLGGPLHGKELEQVFTVCDCKSITLDMKPECGGSNCGTPDYGLYELVWETNLATFITTKRN